MNTIADLRRAADAATAARGQAHAELTRRVQEQVALEGRLRSATLESDPLEIAGLHVRQRQLTDEVARLRAAHAAAVSSAQHAQQHLTNALARLDHAQHSLERLLVCREGDVEVLVLSIGRWRELLAEHRATIQELSGDVVELPMVPPLAELVFR